MGVNIESSAWHPSNNRSRGINKVLGTAAWRYSIRRRFIILNSVAQESCIMKKVLTTPIKDEDLLSLKVGDVVYLTGMLITCRDVGHHRLIELGGELPVNLKGLAIFHARPM